MRILFSPPDITQMEIDEVVDTLKSGWITTGPKTKEFEKEIKNYTGADGCICLNSATAAMETCLRYLGIGPGDEVITSAYTYSASASVIAHVGAKIVLCDTQKGSFYMDYDQLESLINEKTKAIIPVDLGGVPADYKRIFNIVEKKKKYFRPSTAIQKNFGRIVVLADSAHAFGSEYEGIKCGQIADFTAFSFHAVKNLTTAEGGALVWKKSDCLDEDIYKDFQLLTLHGQTKDALSKTKLGSWEYDIVGLNYKYNMADIMAAIGLAQLKRYSEIMEKRRAIIELYEKGLENTDIMYLKHNTENYHSTGHLFLTRVSDFSEDQRNTVIERMGNSEIATNVHYKPLPLLTAYQNLGFNIYDYPNAYEQYKNEITLPLHSLMTFEQAEYCIEKYKEIIDEIRN